MSPVRWASSRNHRCAGCPSGIGQWKQLSLPSRTARGDWTNRSSRNDRSDRGSRTARRRRIDWSGRSNRSDGRGGSSWSDRGRSDRLVRKERRAPQEQRERLARREQSDLRDPPECRVRLVHRGHRELQPLRPTTVSIMGPGTKRVWAQLKSEAHSIAIRSTCSTRRQSASWSRLGHRLCRAEAVLKPSTRQTERTGSHSREKYL